MTASTFHGAEVEALRTTALVLGAAAEHLECVDLSVAARLGDLAWTGPDATRFRSDWTTRHAPVLHVAARVLRLAAQRLLREADEQETASDAGGSWWRDLGRRIDGVLAQTAERYGGLMSALGGLTTTVGAAELLAPLRVRATQALDVAAGTGVLRAIGDWSIGPVTSGALTTLSVAGGAFDAHRAYRGVQDGDAWAVVDGGTSAGLAGAALLKVPGAAHAGVAWTVGSAVGQQLDGAMQGTDFHRRFTERMEPAFDLGGAIGMANTPGALVVTAAESVAISAQEALGSVRDGWVDAADSWRRLTNPYATGAPAVPAADGVAGAHGTDGDD